MKNIKFIPFVLILLAILLSACGGAVNPGTSSTGGGKTQASIFGFTGVIASIDGTQWVVKGPKIQVDMKVDLSVIKDGPFTVGDTIKVEVRVDADGLVDALRIEAPSTSDLSNDNNNGNSNSNTNGSNNTNGNGNSNSNTNDDNGNDDNGNTNDDNQ